MPDTDSVTFTEPNTFRRSWERVDGIDLLRGLSIIFVLMNHVNMRLLGAAVPYSRGWPPQLTYALVWNGQSAVQMFFVISGYLITSTSIRRWKYPAALDARAFYLLRFARIAPLLLLLLLVLSGLHVAQVTNYVVAGKAGGLGRALLAALTFHIGYLEAIKGYLPGNWDILWSLSVEEIFYLLFPLMARILKNRSALVAILLLFVIAGPFARTRLFNPNPVWREYSYLGGMDGIALGCLTAMFLSGKHMSRPWKILCAAFGSAILIFSLGFSLQGYRWGLGRTGLNFTVLAIGVCLVIAAASQSGWRTPRILSPLLALGQRSYEIYLTHMFAVLALFAVFIHFGKPLRVVPVLFLSCILASGGLGWLVAWLYAEPLNRFLRRRSGVAKTFAGAAIPERD